MVFTTPATSGSGCKKGGGGDRLEAVRPVKRGPVGVASSPIEEGEEPKEAGSGLGSTNQSRDLVFYGQLVADF